MSIKKSQISIGIIGILGIVAAIGTNVVTKMILMSKRKSTEKMIEDLQVRFNIDYNDYKDIPYETLEIISHDGLKLKGFYFNLFPESNKVVIIHHGYTANHYVGYQYMDIFKDEGFNILMIDMRSHGESEGKIISYGEYETLDLKKWVDFIKKRFDENCIIGLHGQSMGAATVLNYVGTYQEDVQFAIADCGYSNAEEVIKYRFKQLKVPLLPLYFLVKGHIKYRHGVNLAKISPKDAVQATNVPILFIHGTNDTTVPSYMSEGMYKSKTDKKNKLYLVEGAEHMQANASDRARYTKTIKDFISEVLYS